MDNRSGPHEIGGMGYLCQKLDMAKKGTNNHLLAAAIAAGLRINDDGTVTGPNGRIIKPFQKLGYSTICIQSKEGRKQFTLARLVCWLHYGPPPGPGHMVDHINQNRADDRPENLRWATASENTSNTNERVRAWNRTLASRLTTDKKLRGASHPGSISQEQINTALRMIAEKKSQSTIAETIGCTQTVISKLARGKHWSQRTNTP